MPGRFPGGRLGNGSGTAAAWSPWSAFRQVIRAKNLNRVVIGGCSPRTHETLFQDTVRKAGLNKYLVEIANIRDQDTWVHLDQPGEAAEKAEELIRMAVAGVQQSHALADHVLPMNKDVLVVGGGVAGMNAALSLADQGFKVYLVERSGQLGGVAGKVRKTLEGEDVQAYMPELVASDRSVTSASRC